MKGRWSGGLVALAVAVCACKPDLNKSPKRAKQKKTPSRTAEAKLAPRAQKTAPGPARSRARVDRPVSTPPARGRPRVAKDVTFDWGVKIPVRDGVRLNATVYRPTSPKPVPALLMLTPYTADTYHKRAYYFAQHGYGFALVDVRGRGNSGGTFAPFLQDANDGHDVVEWLAKQPWCNGKVGMWGGSYSGYNQWVTAAAHPPHLRSIAPAASVYPGFDFPMANNIMFPYSMRWLTLTSGATANAALFRQDSFWIRKYQTLYKGNTPFKDFDLIVGNRSGLFRKWVAHPELDEYWDATVPTDDALKRVEIPILSITGHYDADQDGALKFYQRHNAETTARGRAAHFLLVGPWNHAGTRTPKRRFGGVEFSKASIVDMNRLHKEWFDWTLKGRSRPPFLKKRVVYYVAGTGEWRYADSLGSVTRSRRKLYLDSASIGAESPFGPGVLSGDPPKAGKPDRYTYDPLDPRPAELERTEIENFLTDQRYALLPFGNGLVYHTRPLPKPVELTGFVRLAVWLSLDVPDTDFKVDLYEVLPSGASVFLTSDLLRARYRTSQRRATAVKPGAVLLYRFTRFTFFSRRIGKWSRLRLVISSPNSIYFQKNHNSGRVVADETRKDARTAHITLYHDEKHPSFLDLPLGTATSSK